jgi:hypothetical protein
LIRVDELSFQDLPKRSKGFFKVFFVGEDGRVVFQFFGDIFSLSREVFLIVFIEKLLLESREKLKIMIVGIELLSWDSSKHGCVNISLLWSLRTIYVSRDIEIIVVFDDLISGNDSRKFFFILSGHDDIDDSFDIAGSEFIVFAVFDIKFRCIDDLDIGIRFSLF